MAPAPDAVSLDIRSRAVRTLDLMHRWGYAPTLDALASELMRGPVSRPELLRAIQPDDAVILHDPFVFLRAHGGLLEKSRRRVSSHVALNGGARIIAERFAEDLARACPLVDCVALSGSVASGGFEPGDDIDVNLFVADGAKYLVYALALAFAFRETLRFRKTRGLRKLICINVLWTASQAAPFDRQDEQLAFELLHSRPLRGGEHLQKVIAANPWLEDLFPQIGTDPVGPPMPPPGRIGRAVGWVGRHPRWLRAFDRTARLVTRAIYDAAHWLRRNDRAAVERLRFLQRVKYPYEVFQD